MTRAKKVRRVRICKKRRMKTFLYFWRNLYGLSVTDDATVIPPHIVYMIEPTCGPGGEEQTIRKSTLFSFRKQCLRWVLTNFGWRSFVSYAVRIRVQRWTSIFAELRWKTRVQLRSARETKKGLFFLSVPRIWIPLLTCKKGWELTRKWNVYKPRSSENRLH